MEKIIIGLFLNPKLSSTIVFISITSIESSDEIDMIDWHSDEDDDQDEQILRSKLNCMNSFLEKWRRKNEKKDSSFKMRENFSDFKMREIFSNFKMREITEKLIFCRK